MWDMVHTTRSMWIAPRRGSRRSHDTHLAPTEQVAPLLLLEESTALLQVEEVLHPL